MVRGLDGFLLMPVWRCAVLRGLRRASLSPFSGGHGEGETPLPIPNRAVKPFSADGTWLARARESRTPPVICREDGPPAGGPFVLWGRAIGRLVRVVRQGARGRPVRVVRQGARGRPVRVVGPGARGRLVRVVRQSARGRLVVLCVTALAGGSFVSCRGACARRSRRVVRCGRPAARRARSAAASCKYRTTSLVPCVRPGSSCGR
jgi:hypothetical protein